jgi:phage tail-like protein
VSTLRRRAYRFANAAQWNTCLFEGADRSSKGGRAVVHPFQPYGHTPVRYPTPGAAAPAVTEVGEIIWRDDRARLYRLARGDDVPVVTPAPGALASAQRIVASSRRLWAASAAGASSLHCFDNESGARLLSVELPGMRIVDIAAHRRDGVMALCERAGTWIVVHVDCAGQWELWSSLEGIVDATGLAYLWSQDRVVVLAAHGTRLYGYDHGIATARFDRRLGTARPCYTATVLASDGRARLVLIGIDDAAYGAGPRVLVLDGEGNRLEDFALDAVATGVAATADAIVVTDGAALVRFDSGDTATATNESRCVAVTPLLYSPEDDEVHRWSRIEATATLPPGTTLQLAYVAADDPDVIRAGLAITGDGALPMSERLHRLGSAIGPWTIAATYTGSAARAGKTDFSVPLPAPLHDVRERHIWVAATLVAAPGAHMPELTLLEVLYAMPSLMDRLPALYRRSAGQPGDFLRALVGVLDATTQDTDARIASMADLVHPHTAPVRWLDFLAEWTGLPWDDALAEDQKRRIAARAADIAAERGTRRGLEIVLECLMPEVPHRFRVIDVSADYEFATVGGGVCSGSRLPAVLAGLPMTAAQLGERAVLGHMRLACAGPSSDPASRFAGNVVVEVMATAEERRAWQPWIYRLVSEMVPVTSRLRLRWVSAAASWYRDRLDDAWVLEADPEAYLGTGAVTGLAHLASEGPIELTRVGVDAASRLG